MSQERALNFDQWKTFHENYKPMRVWLWLVYKFIENYCDLRLFSEIIQVEKSSFRYPTSINRIVIQLLVSSWIKYLVPVAATLSTNEEWYISFVLRIKITSWACLVWSGLKFIFVWKARLFSFSKSLLWSFAGVWVSFTTEKKEVSSANSFAWIGLLQDH